MQNADATMEQLAQLRGLGLRLAVDDFGTGYSSLRYLHEFPIDVLKIARPFVEGVASSPQKAALARVIVDLGATLGMQVVAEGIESTEQLERLRELGTELGQGYLLGRPVNASEITRLLEQPCVSLPAAVPAE
jgi:EAL domain-containing protein (putative c-di-GMP-specific phosphodiesterase class I)